MLEPKKSCSRFRAIGQRERGARHAHPVVQSTRCGGRALYDRHVEALPAVYHDTVLHTLAPTWLPIAAAMAHYEACQALGLSELDQVRCAVQGPTTISYRLAWV
jgi:hypothetical protein